MSIPRKTKASAFADRRDLGLLRFNAVVVPRHAILELLIICNSFG
jgi:hypothetical protein